MGESLWPVGQSAGYWGFELEDLEEKLILDEAVLLSLTSRLRERKFLSVPSILLVAILQKKKCIFLPMWQMLYVMYMAHRNVWISS